MINESEVKSAIDKRGHRFFSITFKRKTKGKNGEPVGSLRKMLCRRHVRKHTGNVLAPGERAAEDRRCGVLTVWDVETFLKKTREYKATGMRHISAVRKAGKESYRRINLAEVIEMPSLT